MAIRVAFHDRLLSELFEYYSEAHTRTCCAASASSSDRLSYRRAVTIGASLFLIAVGAILKFAVTADVAGIDLQIVGVILMIVGGLGLVLGLVLFLTSDRRQPPPRGY